MPRHSSPAHRIGDTFQGVYRNRTSAWLSCLVFGIAISGCPGDLEDPARFGYDSGGGGGGGGADQCPEDYNVVNDLFANRCGGSSCHGAGSAFIDLVSEGVEARVLDQDSSACSIPYVSSTDPANSYLLDKTTDSPSCGGSMPPGSSLSAVELACLRGWVESVAAGMSMPPMSSMDAGVDASSTPADASADGSGS